MTIHSDWARILHEECPEAFCTGGIPKGRFDVGVIDGHLQLMCLHAGLHTWDAFLTHLFVKPIQRLYAAGCKTVVLCFDAYENVPSYKAMTQLKRAKPHKVCVFGAEQDLPQQIPQETMVFLMNRHFKLKLIELACARVPATIAETAFPGHPERRLIVDYRCVVEYAPDAPHVPVPLQDLTPLGESDIKFVRYVRRYGNALVHAIDGDYMAIALLYYAAHGLRDDNRIFLFRQLSRLGGAAAAAAAEPAPKRAKAATVVVSKYFNNKKPQSNKASRADGSSSFANVDEADADDNNAADNDNNNDDSEMEEEQPKKKPKKKNEKCWVDMQLLFTVIADAIWQSIHGMRPINAQTLRPFSDGDAVHAAVLLMLCAGTDFSRPMPLLGPKRLWEHLPDFVPILLQAAPVESEAGEGGGPNVPLVAQGVIAPLYRAIFAKHVSPAAAGLEGVMASLRAAPKLSLATTTRLPSSAQVHTTLKNVGWVMRYWLSHNEQVPAPLDGTHGFVRCPSTSQITFDDVVAARLG